MLYQGDLSIAWHEHAACVHPQIDPEDFFPEGNFRKNSTEYKRHIGKLTTICGNCPVFDDCRQYAEATREEHGFWAGESANTRRERWQREDRERRNTR